MPDRRDATDLLTGVFEDEVRRSPANLAGIQAFRQLAGVHAMGAAGQDQEWLASLSSGPYLHR